MKPASLTGPRRFRRGPAGSAADPAIVTYLDGLFGLCQHQLVEVRFRREHGMGQLFYGTSELPDAARVIEGLSRRTDVYVGVAPRNRREGGKAAIRVAWAAWVDCDGAEAIDGLGRFVAEPSMIVGSGSSQSCHAYWLLDAPVAIDVVEDLNRRLAEEIGADVRSADGARILRPPSTLNMKHDPPRPVVLERAPSGCRYGLGELAETVPPLPAPPKPVTRTESPASDPLRGIAPETYVRALLGVEVPRSRKICCPFHPDRTPSLHVYETPEAGWYCFGCGRGTSIYDMAAAAWQIGTRGPDFLELRSRLRDLFHIGG